MDARNGNFSGQSWIPFIWGTQDQEKEQNVLASMKMPAKNYSHETIDQDVLKSLYEINRNSFHAQQSGYDRY